MAAVGEDLQGALTHAQGYGDGFMAVFGHAAVIAEGACGFGAGHEVDANIPLVLAPQSQTPEEGP